MIEELFGRETNNIYLFLFKASSNNLNLAMSKLFRKNFSPTQIFKMVKMMEKNGFINVNRKGRKDLVTLTKKGTSILSIFNNIEQLK